MSCGGRSPALPTRRRPARSWRDTACAFAVQPRPLGGRVPFAAAVLHEFGVAPHSGQVLLQNICVAVLLPKHIRHDFSASAHPTEPFSHLPCRSLCRSPVRSAAGSRFFSASRRHRSDTSLQRADSQRDSFAVGQKICHRPSSRGAPGWGSRWEDRRGCSWRPDGIFHEFVEKRIRAFKKAGSLHVGVHRNGGENPRQRQGPPSPPAHIGSRKWQKSSCSRSGHPCRCRSPAAGAW